MDDKVVALMGAAAGMTLLSRRLRPVAKLAMRGVVAATDATQDARRGLAELYAEAKAEQRGDALDAGAAQGAQTGR